jgi:uncharacterized protein
MNSRIENYFLYHPRRYPHDWVEPDAYGLEFENVYLESFDGESLHGWWIPSGRSEYAVLFCHGNGGNIAWRLDLIKILMQQLTHPPSFLIFDYRGYGKSSGRPHELNLYSDTVLFLDYLQNILGYPPDRTVLLGRSLGSAVALQTALDHVPAGLILECPLLSVQAVSRHIFRLFRIPRRWMNQVFDNEEKIRRVACPLLVIHGDRDRIIPFKQGCDLYRAAPDPKTFHRAHGAHHDDIYIKGGTPYFKAYEMFLSSLQPDVERIRFTSANIAPD